MITFPYFEFVTGPSDEILWSNWSPSQSAGTIELINYRGLRLTHESPGYDIKQSDCEAPVMLEVLGNAE